MCPGKLQEHLRLNADRYQGLDGSESYDRIREMIEQYLMVQGAGIDSGPKPMKIDAFTKGYPGPGKGLQASLLKASRV